MVQFEMDAGSLMERTNPTEEVLAQVRSVRARGALRRWLKRESATLLPTSWTSEGFTEAQVLGIYIQDYKDHLNGVIMKIVEKGERDKEFAAHKRAVKDSPEFAKTHLAKLFGSAIPLSDGGSIIFQSVAGGGFDEMIEVDQALSHYVQPTDACSRIIKSLLEEWNTESFSVSENVGAVLDKALGARLTDQGTVATWAAPVPGLLIEPCLWLSRGGQPLINPFALVGERSVGGQLKMILTRGKVHGDLHPGNVLTGKNEEDMPYCLVDLSRYTASGPLAWDPAYLTLTMVAKLLPQVGFRDREALQQWILDPRAPVRHDLPVPLRATVTGVYEAADAWAQSRGGRSTWERQHLLCLTAIALILTGRSRLLRPEDRTWFFWLAARAATQLLPSTSEFAPGDLHGLPEPLITADVINMDDRRRPGPIVKEPLPKGTVSEEAESWTELVAELRVVRLDAPDRPTLAARTETLRGLLARTRTVLKGNGGEAWGYLEDLAVTLDEALRPGTPNAEVRAAAAHAGLLRIWLLNELS